LKCGNIGTAPLLELLLDELADREDISVRSVTTGAKMLAEEVEEALPKIFDFNPDLIVFYRRTQRFKDPQEQEKYFWKRKFPSIFISDAPGKRLKKSLKKTALATL
jgi:methylenetetrahydromethanopterin dehydrogenase